MLRVLVLVLVFAVTLYALLDCIRTDGSRVRHLPKLLWVVLIVLVAPIGPLIWLLAGRDRGAGPPQRTQLPRPVAPDDDPDFLRNLDIERRRREQRGDPDGADTAGGG